MDFIPDMAIGHTWVSTPLVLALSRAVTGQVPEILGNQARLRGLICKFWGQTTQFGEVFLFAPSLFPKLYLFRVMLGRWGDEEPVIQLEQ